MTIADSPVHESYSFVCLNCGHGWERTFEIRHVADPVGGTHAEYFVNGLREPSPLTQGMCGECGGHRIRILRPGRVASVRRPATGSP